MNRDNTRIILKLFKDGKIEEEEALNMIFDNDRLTNFIPPIKDNGDME